MQVVFPLFVEQLCEPLVVLEDELFVVVGPLLPLYPAVVVVVVFVVVDPVELDDCVQVGVPPLIVVQLYLTVVGVDFVTVVVCVWVGTLL